MDYTTPVGFRDVLYEEAEQRERLIRDVQGLFASRGFVPIETPTLERMDVMEAATKMPPSSFRLFDMQGELLAMRPDVTMQVARMCVTRLAGQPGPFRFRYTQRVFRSSADTDSARELTQIGVEDIGEAGPSTDADLVGLFIEALELCGLSNFRVALGTVSVLRSVLAACGADASWCSQVLAAYHASDFVQLDELVAASSIADAYKKAITGLPYIKGGREAIEAARALVAPLGCESSLDAFTATIDALYTRGIGERLFIDFSIMSSFQYYTGIVFEAFAPNLPTSLGSGGRYDSMLAAYGEPREAAGFAFYLEQVMASLAAPVPSKDRPLRIAVPKGSLNADAIACLAKAGLDTTGLENPGRRLTIENPGVRYIIVRPTDAPKFVALGAADCGMCGKDSLLEANLDVVELTDLKFGACRFIVAESEGTTEAVNERYRTLGSIRIATKYPRIAKSFFDRRGMQVEIVKLHGNIELAPITGLAERIVDITATGTTLRENHLTIVDEVLGSTARFFGNACSLRMDPRVAKLAAIMKEQVEE